MEKLPDTLEAAESQLRNSVYEATRLLEDLERAGKVQGQGHHLRQALAEAAVETLRERWAGETDEPADILPRP